MVGRRKSRGRAIERPSLWWFSVYSLLVSKASLEGVNAAKRLRVREGSFGSKRVLPGFPVTNVETRRAKRGRASARKKTGSPRARWALAMTKRKKGHPTVAGEIGASRTPSENLHFFFIFR